MECRRQDGVLPLRKGNRGGDVMAVDISVAGQGFCSPVLPGCSSPIGRRRERIPFIAAKDGQHFLVVTAEEAQDPAVTPFVVILNWQRLLPAGN